MSKSVRHIKLRQILIALLCFSFSSSSAQTTQVKVFKRTDYINGNFYRETFDTIAVSHDRIDIYFFKRHFFSPYYLPDKFIDKRYKNQIISIWRDQNDKKDYQKNWENTYIYDSLGRVINFTYSSSFICSSLPYNYSVIYNLKGQVEQIINSINLKDRFRFHYNSQDNIVKFEKFSFDLLEMTLTLED